MNEMKRFLAFILTAIMLTVNASAIDLYVGFTRLNSDTPPTIVDGRMLVPLRAIFETLGATVVWNPDTQTATAYYYYTPISIQINSNTAYVNGEPHTLDIPAQLINGCTMVPVRFISEAFNRNVTWHQETQTAVIEGGLATSDSLYVPVSKDVFHYSDSCNGNTYDQTTWAEVLGRKMQPCEECVPFVVRYWYLSDSDEPEYAAGTVEESGTDSSVSSNDSNGEIISITVVPVNGSTGNNGSGSSSGSWGNSGNSSSSGSWGESSTTNEITGDLNRTAFWVKNGKSYHFSSSCPSLARSKNIRKGTLQDALNAGKTDPCNNCAGGR